MRLIPYIRVSTDEQAETGRSLEIQDQQLQRYAAENGHELLDAAVDDGVSASTPLERRPGGLELLEQLRDGLADGALVQRLDRMFRLGADALVTGTWFRQRGLTILGAQDAIDIATDDGWMVFGMRAVVAENERNKIAARGREVSAALREQGRAWGPTPYGCINIDGQLYRDPRTWRIRCRIVTQREYGMSYRQLADSLFSERVANPSGGKHWHTSTLRGLIEGHSQLQHIPPLPEDHDAAVSEEARA